MPIETTYQKLLDAAPALRELSHAPNIAAKFHVAIARFVIAVNAELKVFHAVKTSLVTEWAHGNKNDKGQDAVPVEHQPAYFAALGKVLETEVVLDTERPEVPYKHFSTPACYVSLVDLVIAIDIPGGPDDEEREE
ncbi:MAG: hypothetical protein JRL30_01160 [Deltaproteobacteria bacterium]|nr:hypothetical protein [Deltaproteobacteria bacterium]